ncbi:hypothetical protein BJX62DRAFT_14268 [Aspergillus germanicus]
MIHLACTWLSRTELNEQEPLFPRSVFIADPSDDKNDLKGRKGSFAASTCSWFFEIEQMRHWLGLKGLVTKTIGKSYGYIKALEPEKRRYLSHLSRSTQRSLTFVIGIRPLSTSFAVLVQTTSECHLSYSGAFSNT